MNADKRVESPIPILPLSTPDVETEKLIKMKDEEVSDSVINLKCWIFHDSRYYVTKTLMWIDDPYVLLCKLSLIRLLFPFICPVIHSSASAAEEDAANASEDAAADARAGPVTSSVLLLSIRAFHVGEENHT